MSEQVVIPKNVVLNPRIDQAVKKLIRELHLPESKGYSPALRIIAEKGIDAMEASNQARPTV